MASIAQMTGSLIDSGCKHIMPVRASFDFFTKFCKVPQENMLRNKMKYSVHKGDLILNTGTHMFPDGAANYTTNDAYPAVTTTLPFNDADYDETVMTLIADVYDMSDTDLFDARDNHFMPETIEADPGAVSPEAKEKEHIKACVRRMPDFRFNGYSLGLAYAHPTSGDTVCSSLIGGLMTVRNGPFRVCTGDKIQWVFFFEVSRFDAEGVRIKSLPHPAGPAPAAGGEDPRAMTFGRDAKRLRHVLQGNGVFDFISFKRKMDEHKVARTIGKIPLAVIKPYMERFGEGQRYPRDACRVFAKALGNARPWENVDIMICTQH